MSDLIRPLRHEDRDPAEDPTGERLLDRKTRPWEAWIPPYPALVLGNSQAPERELNVTAVLRDGIPVHKRIGGGGAVLLSPGCVCLALRFRRRKSASIQDYFALGSAVIAAVARERLGLDLVLRGISDLACATPEGDKKVAGSSLYLPRDFALYLVSILIDPDLGRIAEYLGHPSKEPDYRAGRAHGEFLAGWAGLSGRPVRPQQALRWFQEAIPERLTDELDWESAPA
jgi:lipoate-protein ligase A